MDFSVSSLEDGPTRVVLKMEGELDMLARDHLVAAGQLALSQPQCAELVLDMSGISFLDSTGISGLITVRHSASSGFWS
jgi:anti-anti-sigma factor